MPSHLCANRRVYASLDSLSGNRLRKVQFRSFFREAPKVLYNTTATTDSDGVATFDALQFSVDGRSGIFEISFVCDGIYSASSVIGTFTGSAISSLTFDSQVSYVDFCGTRQKLQGEKMFTLTNVLSAVEMKLKFETYYPDTFLPVSGKKAVKVLVESSVPSFYVEFPVVPMLTENDGNFVVTLNVFHTDFKYEDATVSLYIGVDDDENTNTKLDFQFEYTFRCPSYGLSSSDYEMFRNPCTSGFISVFEETNSSSSLAAPPPPAPPPLPPSPQPPYVSSDSRIWTPFYPTRWNSAEKISLNFNLSSYFRGSCSGEVPSYLLVTAAPKQKYRILVSSHYGFARLDLCCFLALSNPLFIIEFVGINTGP
jgi:hypothetical protein